MSSSSGTTRFRSASIAAWLESLHDKLESDLRVSKECGLDPHPDDSDEESQKEWAKHAQMEALMKVIGERANELREGATKERLRQVAIEFYGWEEQLKAMEYEPVDSRTKLKNLFACV